MRAFRLFGQGLLNRKPTFRPSSSMEQELNYIGGEFVVARGTGRVRGAGPRERAGRAGGGNKAIARVASLLAIAIVGAVVTAVLLDRGGEGAARLGEGGAAASVAAFHAGLVCAAVLVALGGIVSLAGIENQRADAQATT